MTHDLLTKLPGIALFSRQQQVKYTEDAERTWSTLNQALLRSWECCTRVRSGHSWAECCWQGRAWGGHCRGDLPLRARGEGLGTLCCVSPPDAGKQARWLRGSAAVPGGCVTGRDLIAVICARFPCINPFPQAPRRRSQCHPA